MKNMPEYYMRSGMPISGGNRVTGHYIEQPEDMGGWDEPPSLKMKCYIANVNVLTRELVEIDPNSIEPIPVNTIEVTLKDKFIIHRCPNCNCRVETYHNHCTGCGIALDHSKEV